MSSKFIFMFHLGILVIIIVILSLIIWVSRQKNNHRLPIHSLETFCISLPDKTERRKNLVKRFQSFGMRISFIRAIDTRGDLWEHYQNQLTKKGVLEMKRNLMQQKREKHHELTPGAIGCFLSHIQTYQHILTEYGYSPHPSIFLILEDDCQPQPNFSKLQPFFQKGLEPYKIDLLVLGGIYNGPHQKTSIHNLNLIHLVPGSHFYGTYGYLISIKGIQKIVKELEKTNFQIEKQIDSFLSDMIQNWTLDVYFIIPNVCHHANEDATSIQTLPV